MEIKILIVDDCLDSLDNMVHFLECFDYQICKAMNGQEALDIMKYTSFDIVLTDIKMPEMDGMQLLHAIRTNYPRIAVIIATAFYEYSYMDVIKAGAIDYISKPFTRDEFQAKVCRVVREQQLQIKLRQDLIEQQKNEEEKINLHAIIYQQEKMATIGQLAAGVAHEINNPIGFITSNLGTLQKYAGKLLDYTTSIENGLGPDEIRQLRKKLKIDLITEDINDLISESIEGATRLKEIVQNLKSFSRVDEKEQKEVNLNDCLEQTIKVIWNELKYKVKLLKDYGELPLTRCYPQLLNQVFMNLLINASHAIEEQGEITIRTNQDGEHVFVIVSDTGCGIPQENLNRLFEPFFTTKGVGKGTGLGLSIANEIIKKHNGEISVESEVGIGSTFTIQLPILNFAR
jgi:signal transduction histidine kinase